MPMRQFKYETLQTEKKCKLTVRKERDREMDGAKNISPQHKMERCIVGIRSAFNLVHSRST